MAGGDPYVLGYRLAEQERLQRQAEELGLESARLFDEIGIAESARVVEIGCGPRGCLDLLSTRVGVTGKLVGVEINADAVALARTFVAEHGLQNVEVIAADARSTGLPRGAFDLVTSRLVLVLIPQPEQVIAEAVALARPGGVVAFHEMDWAALMCDPPSQAWTTVVKLFRAVAAKNGNDFYLGRRLPRLLREAGLVDLHVNPIVHVYPPGHPRRAILVDFIDNMKERILALDLVSEEEIGELKEALAKHHDNPGGTVFHGPFVQAWGRNRHDARHE